MAVGKFGFFISLILTIIFLVIGISLLAANPRSKTATASITAGTTPACNFAIAGYHNCALTIDYTDDKGIVHKNLVLPISSYGTYLASDKFDINYNPNDPTDVVGAADTGTWKNFKVVGGIFTGIGGLTLIATIISLIVWIVYRNSE